jgi:uncharacterized repeat protein (TIGR03833 family)
VLLWIVTTHPIGDGEHQETGEIRSGKNSPRMTVESAINMLDGRIRHHIRSGITVSIVLKQDQRTGKLTRGIVKDILTNSASHPHGIKVRLVDGQVGRVQKIEEESIQ